MDKDLASWASSHPPTSTRDTRPPTSGLPSALTLHVVSFTNFSCLFVHICVCEREGVCLPHGCGSLWSPEEDIASIGVEVPGSCVLPGPDVVLGTKLWSSLRTASTLDC